MKKYPATEVLRVAQDVAAIRAALHQHGYRTRKRSKQPVWIVYTPTGNSYILTYQPAPINAWVLHSQNNNSDRHAIETLVQHALASRGRG